MGNDRSIAEAAWTSSLDYQKKNTRTDADVERVVKMLAEKGHSVPFESIILRFWIKMPIQTDRQHQTHRIQSSSGMSGRYRTMPNEWFAVPDDVASITEKVPMTPDVNGDYDRLCKAANEWYNDTLIIYKLAEKSGTITNDEYKRVREFFRGVLPQNNMTERVCVMNLRSFANYYRLRSKMDAQKEIQVVAELMLEAVKAANVCPVALQALEACGWVI